MRVNTSGQLVCNNRLTFTGITCSGKFKPEKIPVDFQTKKGFTPDIRIVDVMQCNKCGKVHFTK